MNPYASVLVLTVPLLLGAQQQPSTARAGWPCGARLDPSYFQVAEGTGGHLLLVAPEEIADSAALLTAFDSHPETIFRLAGALKPGLHEFKVPIDPSIESVVFSLSVQCMQIADVVPPSGAFANRDAVTDLSNFRAQRMVIVKQPEAGIWTVRVSGSGVGGIVVQARSTIGFTHLEFAPTPDGPFTRLPSAGVENVVRIRLSGEVTATKASIVSAVSTLIADLPLDAGQTAGVYQSHFTDGGQPFRVLVTGKDSAGFPFQRMHPPLITPR